MTIKQKEIIKRVVDDIETYEPDISTERLLETAAEQIRNLKKNTNYFDNIKIIDCGTIAEALID